MNIISYKHQCVNYQIKLKRILSIIKTDVLIFKLIKLKQILSVKKTDVLIIKLKLILPIEIIKCKRIISVIISTY